jgi:hypothetical protein
MTSEDRQQMPVAAEHTQACDEADDRWAAQALKALIKESQTVPRPQKPRLTLGRVPKGGPGRYVVYVQDWRSEVCSWDGSKWHMTSDRAVIHGAFGPIPSHESVTKAWEAAGRPS